ncbi:hypothetical protein ACP26L_21215 [Paenibacillus sp. S-38]|uniref:hypothetical protein n=1 Tax=Paenibacillus sp. S-38 TaxID=3416710 RepID=UPI003CE6A718
MLRRWILGKTAGRERSAAVVLQPAASLQKPAVTVAGAALTDRLQQGLITAGHSKARHPEGRRALLR